jgi:hypothetical protein
VEKMKSLRQGLFWVRTNLSVVLLTLAVASQFWILFRNYLPDLVQKIWHAKAGSALWRSGSIHLGDDYAQYIEFIKTNTPEDALVIIPKEDQAWNFGNVGLMQYHLYPRKIADCPVDTLDECILNLKGKNTYILAPNSTFPPRELADQVKDFISYDQESGLYVPLP